MKFSAGRKEWGQFTIGLLAAGFQLACMFLAGWQEVLLVSISFIPGFIIYYQACRENRRSISLSEKLVMGVILLLSLVSIMFIMTGVIKIG